MRGFLNTSRIVTGVIMVVQGLVHGWGLKEDSPLMPTAMIMVCAGFIILATIETKSK